MRLTHPADLTHPVHLAAERMVKRIADRTKSEVKITIFPDNALGAPPEAAQQDRLGVIDMMLLNPANIEAVAPYAAADADITLRLVTPVKTGLEQEKLIGLFNDVEMPLVEVLGAMEQAGVLVDVDLLKRMSADVTKTLSELTTRIYEKVGYQFNVNSTAYWLAVNSLRMARSIGDLSLCVKKKPFPDAVGVHLLSVLVHEE